MILKWETEKVKMQVCQKLSIIRINLFPTGRVSKLGINFAFLLEISSHSESISSDIDSECELICLNFVLLVNMSSLAQASAISQNILLLLR